MKFKESLVIILILSALIVLAYYDVAFFGKTLKLTTANPQALMTGVYGQEKNKLAYFPVHSTDMVTFEEPIFHFIRESFRDGIFPFWNPHQACGYPLIGMMQYGLFWPLHYILFTFPQEYAFDLMMFARYLLAGGLLFWFMRSLRFGILPALVAAMTFIFSGPMTFSHWAFVNVDILAPFYLLAVDRLVRRPKGGSMNLLALAVFSMFLAGHAEHIFLVSVLAFAFFVFRLFTLKPVPHRKKVLLLWLGGHILGGGLSSFVLFPFLFNWFAEFWHAHPTSLGPMAEAATLVKEAVISFFMPQFFQKEVVTLSFERYSFWGHIGVIPLGLAFISLFCGQKRKLNYFFAGCAFFLFAKSHLNTPLNLIGHLPLFNVTRFYHHTAHLFALTLSILAGMGMRYVLVRRDAWKKAVMYVLVVLMMTAAALVFYRQAPFFDLAKAAAGQAGLLLLLFLGIIILRARREGAVRFVAVALTAALFLELMSYIPRERARRFHSFPDVPYMQALQVFPERSRHYGIYWALYPNTASGYQMDDLGVVHGFLFERYVHFINHLVFKDYFKKDYGSSSLHVSPLPFLPQGKPFLDLLNIRFIVAPPHLKKFFPPAAHPSFPKPIYDRETKVILNPSALSRVFIVHRAEFVADRAAIPSRMKELKKQLREVAVIEGEADEGILKQLSASPLKDRSAAKILKYSPNEVVVQAKLQNPGFLVLGDSFHPEWQVSVNGERKKIYFADYLLRAVFLPAGEHEVRFQFVPRSFYAGCIVSGIGLLLLLLVAFAGRKERTNGAV